MGRNAIELDQVSKRYLLGEHGRSSLREAIGGLARGRKRARSGTDELWALRDITLDVAEGDTVGVIGRNGAGKSTLFRIVTRITEPTRGVSRTRGRVTGLLEVGTGFHPELTGRENVWLNGAILGMSRRQTERRFEEIVEFAGVEQFIDTPVKRYSSGMYLRLAFAVAAHLEPDVLVVDEVLAVGDAEFQRKCLGRMSQAGREGRTVVFVSHDLDAIAQLCPTAVWLDRGEIVSVGPARPLIETYLRSGAGTGGRWVASASAGAVSLRAVAVLDRSGHAAEVLPRDQPFSVELRYRLDAPLPGLDLAVYLVNQRGVRVIDEMCSDSVGDRPSQPGEYVARLRVPPVLNVGTYSIGVWVGTAYENLIDEASIASFDLEGSTRDRPDRAVALQLPWEIGPSEGTEQ